ncbi:MAG: radical SAM protein [Bacteroidales bacterium]|nr:radical SAM protein [Bacteroidales bacterium]
MLFENSIVGPIHSRRLGSSLGVNLLPLKHKYCSYDCIYCECGWNRESENQEMVYATPDELKGLLKKRLEQLKAESARVDSFTFAGNGEPTLYPQFPEMVDVVREMRDLYYPKAVTTLLTNATQLRCKEIFDAVMKLDNPVLKLDAGTERMRQLINKNNDMGCTWDELIAHLTAFGSHGIIQTLLFDGYSEGQRVSNIIDSEFTPYLAYLKQIGPRYVMLYALDRATPEKDLRKLSVEELEQYAQVIRKEGIEVKVYG